MTSFSSLMGSQTLLPIIQAETPEQGVNIAKAMADALSKQTGIDRDKFKESTDDVDTSVDATRDKSGS